MATSHQFVACKFRESDTRSYTYINTGEPLAPGDMARVEDRSGDGWKKVFVVGVTDEAPPFQCKPILGRYVEEPVDTDLLDDIAVPDRIPAASDPLHDEIPW